MGNTSSPQWEGAMPWKECSVIDERLQLVACRPAGQAHGGALQGVWDFWISGFPVDRLQDLRSLSGMRYSGAHREKPASYRYANQLPFQVENFILKVKPEHPSWGARKIR